jgi:hypothetical protein
MLLRKGTASLSLLLASAGIVWGANVNVTIREWDTLSPNTHPHDTEIGPDGSLWYTCNWRLKFL